MTTETIKQSLAELNLVTGLVIAACATDQLFIQAIGVSMAALSVLTIRRQAK